MADEDKDIEELKRELAETKAALAAIRKQQQAAAPGSIAIDENRAEGDGVQAIGNRALAVRETQVAITGDIFAPVTVEIAGSEADDRKARREKLALYLEKLLGQHRQLRIDLVDPDATKLQLSPVYTPLMTNYRPPADHPAKTETPLMSGDREAMEKMAEAAPLSATAFAGRFSHAALLGKPGSGKSTFAQILVLAHAGAIAGHPELNLSLLDVPSRREEDEEEDEEEEEDVVWDGPPLLPVFVRLRDFVEARMDPEEANRPKSLWDFIRRRCLGDSLADLAEPLRNHLRSEGGLVILDGWDEVPETEDCRDPVKKALHEFVGDFTAVRVLLTSRPYAWEQQDWAAPGFTAAELADFEEPQWNAFIDRWFAHVPEHRPSLSSAVAKNAAADLKNAIGHYEYLRDLAGRPLFLTLMGTLSAWKGGRLPEDRIDLYQKSVELLIDNWQNPKLVRNERGEIVPITPGLAEFLRVDPKDVAAALDRLAFETHREQGRNASIGLGTLLEALTRIASKGGGEEVNPTLLTRALSDRIGILTHEGTEVYRFPHPSFQEFLAARWLEGRPGFAKELATLVRENPSRWREVYALTGRLASPDSAWNLLAATCPKKAPDFHWSKRENIAVADEIWEAAALAGELLLEILPEDSTELNQTQKETRKIVIHWLAALVAHGRLEPPERAAAGITLGRLGDPRPGTGLKDGLPGFGWVDIPAGKFLYDDPATEVRIEKAYAISRYPVTVAQYQAFIDAGGYAEARWWECFGGWDRVESGDLAAPENYRAEFQTPNHPRVGISWFEANAFCQWAGEALGRTVRLPSEREWERAARGTDGREYPWGDWEKGLSSRVHANVGDDWFDEDEDGSGIGHPSAVGGFPDGMSPAKLFDVAGNVWEWSADPYDSEEADENPGSCVRVWRGGSWSGDPNGARCSYRYRDNPNSRYDLLGFRVVSSPDSSLTSGL